jgi:hypothetical protein
MRRVGHAPARESLGEAAVPAEVRDHLSRVMGRDASTRPSRSVASIAGDPR